MSDKRTEWTYYVGIGMNWGQVGHLNHGTFVFKFLKMFNWCLLTEATMEELYPLPILLPVLLPIDRSLRVSTLLLVRLVWLVP